MAKLASKSKKTSPPGRSKRARKSVKKSGAGKPLAKLGAKAGKRQVDPLPGDDPFEL
jgi:hypothetical protein